jgi:sn-glycerol 3-phosphate transport system substrate-binding protein
MKRPARSAQWLRLGALAAGCALVAAACGSGKSIIVAGNDTPAATTSPTPPPTNPPAGTTLPGGEGSLPPQSTAPGSPPVTTPPVTNATTTTTPLASLPDCPVDALASATEPVDITFWHGLTADNDDAIKRLTDDYNASQTKVHVSSENQGGYLETIDKFFQSTVDDRPELVMFPDYTTQQVIDSGAVIPTQACVEAAGYDTSQFQPSTVAAYSAAGVQWGMPFNVSNPVLYYNRNMFQAAGLDPDRPPQTLEELRQYSQQLVDSGAASYGLAIESGSGSGGGWYIEQWFANKGELYADNGNGRLAPATRVLYDGPAGVELLTYVQSLINDKLAVYVGDNAGGADQLLKLADTSAPAAMALGSSAFLTTVINTLAGGLVPGLGPEDVGVGPMPGPVAPPTALVGGAALYVTEGKSDLEAAAAWDFMQYMVSPEVQAQFATETGYVPMRADALEIEPALSGYRNDPRYRVAYDQLVKTIDSPASLGPILGPQREIRTITANAVAEIFNGGDVQSALTNAAQQSNALLASYNANN